MRIKLLEDALEDIKANGVSRNLVETVESTVGEKFISSVFNINGLTTERSSIGSSEVTLYINNYLSELKDSVEVGLSPSEKIYKHGVMINYLSKVKDLVVEIGNHYNSKVKSTLELHTSSFRWDNGKPFNIFINNSPLASFFIFKYQNEKEKSIFISDEMNKWLDYGNNEDLFTILTLFVWKDNSLYEYIVNGKPILNTKVTCGELFNSLDGIHMITEGLEETIKTLKSRQKEILDYGCEYGKQDNIFDIWEGLLNTSELSIHSLRALLEIIKDSATKE